MAGVKKKYSSQQTAIWRGEILLILSHAEEAMSIQQMQAKSMFLNGVSSQKIARILADCVDMGLVKRAKCKSSGLMMYKSVAVMKAQGYDVGEEDG